MKLFYKNLWWVGLLIFLYPFYLPLVNKIPAISLELYTYGLEVRDFMIIWVAVGAIIGVVFNIRLTQDRIMGQEILLNRQEDQFVQRIELQYKQFKEQTDKQNKQIQILAKQSRDNRFSSGVELLGNTNESARIGAAFTLYFLANEFNEYRKLTCEILCAHIRTVTNKQEYKIHYTDRLSNEIQTILDLLFKEEYGSIFDSYHKNLAGAICYGANFADGILNNVNFKFVTLNNANFSNAKLGDVDFKDAKLSNVNFESAKLSNINFFRATLSNVSFERVAFNHTLFSFAKFKDKIDFTGTSLANIPLEEIIRPNRSLDLTKPKEETRFGFDRMKIKSSINNFK